MQKICHRVDEIKNLFEWKIKKIWIAQFFFSQAALMQNVFYLK
jgi:hypothetical protein